MRYIRDIIREKESGAPQATAPTIEAETAAETAEPLLLEEPIFTEEAESQPPVALEQLAASRSTEQGAPSDLSQKVFPRPVKPSENESTPLRIRDRAERLAKAAAQAEANDSEADPFDKLRQPASQRRDNMPSVSPLRATQSERPSKAVPELSSPPQSTDMEVRTDMSSTENLTPLVDALEPDKVHMPAPAAGRGSKVSGRVKTRLLGFSGEAFTQDDPFKSAAAKDHDFPVGWLVVVSEKGRGRSFPLHDGVSSVGRGEDQAVCLDIGDNSISRENHISIAFDAERKKFFVGHGGKTNLVRLNNSPLLSTEELNSKDSIRLGETTLRFVAFCDESFSWADTTDHDASRA